jgi:hypothetical protein
MEQREEIKKYLLGELNLQDCKKIEARMEEDTLFAKEMEQEKSIYKALIDLESDKIRNQFRKAEAEKTNTWKKPAKQVWIAVFAAASVILLLVLTQIFFPVVENEEIIPDQQLSYVERFYEPIPTSLRTNKLEDSGKDLFSEGISYLNNKDVEAAYQVFFQLADDKGNTKYHVQWYLALILLELERESEATKHLLYLSGEKNEFKEMAQKILEELNTLD